MQIKLNICLDKGILLIIKILFVVVSCYKDRIVDKTRSSFLFYLVRGRSTNSQNHATVLLVLLFITNS